jgi:sugar phosphate isomerase/epimerase
MKIGFIGNNDLGGVQEDARFAAEHGFEGIEFNYWGDFKDLTFETVARMRAILVEHGVPACALGLWGWNHTSRDAAERETSLKHLARAIDFAQYLGARILITGGGQLQNGSPEENAAEFARVFPPYVEQARKAGLKIALYPVHGNSFFTSIADYERVWKLVPDVGIKLDCANIMHHGDDYLPILRDYGWRVFHVHIKEHLVMDGKCVSQPAAGMGDLQWGKIFAFLHEHHYEGFLTMEPHGALWSRPPLRRKMLLLSKRYIEQFIV